MGSKAAQRPKFQLREISLRETASLIHKLGNTMSFGHNRIDAMSIKIVAADLLKPINFIFTETEKVCQLMESGKVNAFAQGSWLQQMWSNPLFSPIMQTIVFFH